MLQKLKNTLKEQKGFTLVELLAVIVILGIIAAIAVPSIGNIIDNSRDDAEIADALQIINAAKLAHAAEGTVPEDGNWDYSDLGNYLSKSKEQGFTVTYNDTENRYYIANHTGALAAVDADDIESDNTISEDVLADTASE